MEETANMATQLNNIIERKDGDQSPHFQVHGEEAKYINNLRKFGDLAVVTHRKGTTLKKTKKKLQKEVKEVKKKVKKAEANSKAVREKCLKLETQEVTMKQISDETTKEVYF